MSILAGAGISRRHLPRKCFSSRFVAMVLMAFFLNGLSPELVSADSVADQIAAAQRQLNFAIWRVQDIINQPVTAVPRTPDMVVTTYSPGWFHEGASKPDLDVVDIRQTQQFIYDGHQYVTSDLNPGVAFLGSDLEFNPMTKYFYTDRSLPKKRLTEAEMLEVNRLYREIGRCERQVGELEHPEWAVDRARALAAAERAQPLAVKLQKFVTNHRLAVIAALGVVAVLAFSIGLYTNRPRGKQWM